ncbi:hypothetical protein ACT17Q_05095 [Cellulomonas sp. CW35]|nr:hypothetical protein [Cellulomonas sp. PSBB021]
MTTAPATDERPTRLRRAVTGPLLFLFILGDVLGPPRRWAAP